MSSKLLICSEVLEGASSHHLKNFWWLKKWKTNSITLPLAHAHGVNIEGTNHGRGGPRIAAANDPGDHSQRGTVYSMTRHGYVSSPSRPCTNCARWLWTSMGQDKEPTKIVFCLKKNLDLYSGASDRTLFYWSANTRTIENSKSYPCLYSKANKHMVTNKRTASVSVRDHWRFTMKAWFHGVLWWSQACCIWAVVSWTVPAWCWLCFYKVGK